MSEQEGETVLLDKLAGSLLDYVEDEDALDGALRLREDLLDKRLMMTARLQHKMVDNLADGQEHRAQAQQFVQSMIDKFSKRTTQIDAEAERLGIVDAAEKAELGAKVRAKKQKELTLPELHPDFRVPIRRFFE